MRKRFGSYSVAFLIALTLSAAQARCQPRDIAQAESLQKPISVRLKMRPLRELVEQIARRTETPLGVSKNVEQYKVSVFVKERPAGTVLALVARQLELEWQQDSDGRWFLTEPVRVREARLRQARAAEQQRRERLSEYLQRLQKQAQTDFVTLHTRLKQIDEAQDQLQASQAQGWMDMMERLARERAQIADAAATLLRYLAGRVAAAWSQEQWGRFWSGQTMLASTKPIPAALALPVDALQWATLWSPNSFDSPPESALFLARWDRAAGAMQTFLIVRAGERALVFTETIAGADALSSNPDAPSKSGSQTPQIPIRRAPNEPPFQSPYAQGETTLADQLEWLVDRCEVAIIADAFRYPMRVTEPNRNARTLHDWALSLTREEPIDAVYQDGFLLVRHRMRNDLLLSEIDEPTLEAFEQRAAEGLSLDDYAALAYPLTYEQQKRLETPNSCALRVDTTPFYTAIPALRFWASLTPAQKQSARERQPIPYPMLSPVQQRLFVEAIEHALSTPTLSTGDLLMHLDRLYDPEAQQNLAFFLDFWKNFSFEVNTGQVRLIFEDVEDYQQTLQELALSGASVSVQEREHHNYSLYFGFEASRAAHYPIAWQTRRAPNSPTDQSDR